MSQRLAELPKDQPIIAYCRGGFCLMSSEAARLLKQHDYDATMRCAAAGASQREPLKREQIRIFAPTFRER